MRKILLFLFTSLMFNVNGQFLTSEKWEGMTPRNIGPAGMSGRITAIKVSPHNDNHIYVGSASGGLWFSENGGQSWKPIFDQEKVSSIGAIALDPQNPDVIWVGTGEGNPRNSMNLGYGVYRSIDRGKSWKYMGLGETRSIYRILLHPRNPAIAYVAALGSAWGDSSHRGVYKTTDAGKSWEKVLFFNDSTGAGELIMDPVNPDKLIANMWTFRRTPWSFTSGGGKSGMYLTYDGGENWKKITDEEGLPKGPVGRMGLAIAPSDPDRVYALIEKKGKNALYSSKDGGEKWFKVSENDQIGNRPFYYSEIYVDPERPNRLYSLWSLLSMSEDGGRTWEIIAPYNDVHPDHQAFWVHPKDGRFIIEGNDGGLNISRDRGRTWRFVENLPVGQFYHVNIDDEWPYNVYGGMQDNGSWKGPAFVFANGGIRNAYWQELFFGDGFDVVPDPRDPRFVYAMYQEGNLARIDTRTGFHDNIRPTALRPDSLRFHWNAAIASDPLDPGTIYFGSQYLHRTSDGGKTWETISPDLTSNDPEKQKQTESGGLTPDVTGAENHTTIIAIAPSPRTKGEIWVGSDDGKLHQTRDGGENWTDLTGKLKGMPAGAWIPQIEVSKVNDGEAFVVVNDYRRNNWDPYLFHTTDHGRSFRRIVSSGQVEGHCLSVVQDPQNPDLLFLGTEAGLYFSLDHGKNWQKWNKKFPTVPVHDMKIHPKEGDLVIGTFGRSIWILDDLTALREAAGVEKKEMKLFAIPTAYHTWFKTAPGVRFAASTMFEGDNRPPGARITYWLDVDPDSEGLKEDQKRVHFWVMQGKDTIRTFKRDFKQGINRTTWDLEMNSPYLPSREVRKKDQPKPGIVKALPGTYTVILGWGDHRDSASVELKVDPRVEFANADFKENLELAKGLMNDIRSVSDAAQSLAKANQWIRMVNGFLPEDSTEFKGLRKKTKEMGDTISKLQALIFGPKEGKGYYLDNKAWMTWFNSMGSAMNNVVEPVMGPNERRVLRSIHQRTEYTVGIIDSFVKDSWAEYEGMVKKELEALLPKVEAVPLPAQNE
ncbi:MAG: hypothetical protein LPK28_01595 [Bacteroidota bacterium]|nr:hypothetical protein [Bacteroidota bacterium]